MAFLAVLREGFETSVFLLSAFQASSNRAASSLGALAGIAVAVVIGVLIYRGGMKINLGRFFARDRARAGAWSRRVWCRSRSTPRTRAAG